MTDLYTLISTDVDLKHIAGTNGGEFAGACPFCGGRDRFRVWPNADRPGWWCRGCNKHGDDVQYLREHGLSFADACAQLGRKLESRGHADRPVAPPEACDPPGQAWREAGAAFVFWCQNQLTVVNQVALDYLHGRGLTDKTIRTAGLGYNPMGRWSERAKWGLEAERDGNTRMWLPAGIVIPEYADSVLWKIQIRQDKPADPERRYKTVAGSGNVLAGADSVQPGKPAMLVEGPIDRLAVAQATGDVVGVVSCGTSGARRVRWLTQLALASELLVSFDADAAGDEAAHYWLTLPNARRWRPYYADPAQMLQDGQDVRGWVLAGLGKAPAIYPLHPEFATFWIECEAHGWQSHIERHKALCAAAGYDYQTTIEALRA